MSKFEVGDTVRVIGPSKENLFEGYEWLSSLDDYIGLILEVSQISSLTISNERIETFYLLSPHGKRIDDPFYREELEYPIRDWDE